MSTNSQNSNISSEVLRDGNRLETPQVGALSFIVPYLPSILLDTISRNPNRPPPWIDPVEGSLLLADISGFTRMSEQLAEVGKEGAEWLTNIINQYFHSILDIAQDHGGSNIKFGGDALLLLFRGANHAYRAVAAALAMQRATDKLYAFRVGHYRIRPKMTVGVHSGTFWSAVAGLPEHRMQYFILGQDASRVDEAQAAASPSELFITEPTLNMLDGLCQAEQRGNAYRVLRLSRRTALLTTEKEGTLSPSLTQALLPYLLPPIAQALQSGGQAKGIEGEHRKVCIAFINLLGVNELLAEKGPEVLLNELQQYLSSLVKLTNQYNGFLIGNDIYSLGVKLIIAFGAPVAHEHDAVNALRLALQLNRELPQLNLHLNHRIGINSGFVFAGDVGPPYRREYTLMGDAVNLSARLMSSASHSQVLLSRQVTVEAGSSFVVQELSPIRVKGKKEPIPIYALEGERTATPAKSTEQPSALFGREAEVNLFQRLCREVEGGQGRVVIISGNAGIGKSRLSLEFQEHLYDRGWAIHQGACYSHTVAKPFAPWIYVLNSLFDINPADTTEARTGKVLSVVRELLPSFLETASLFNSLLGLSIPQSDIVLSLDDETRRLRLFELILGVLQSLAKSSPLAILVEDIHWADHSSLQLINYISTNFHSSRLLMCLTQRPAKDIELRLPPASTVTFALSELPKEAALQLVNRVLNRPEIPEQVAEAILSKARGNPLFLEEIARSVSQSGTLDQVLKIPSLRLTKEIASLEIPDRIQTLIMARIDTIKGTAKEVLRVASVIGRTFDLPTLRALLDLSAEDASLQARLQELVQLDLVSREEDFTEYTYQFKHALIQEVAYDSLLFTRRRGLHHRVASYLEETHGEQLEPLYEVLVHHYNLSADYPKIRLYSVKAAEKACQVFAHEESIDYYRLGLNSLPEKDVMQSGERSYFLERIGDCFEASGHHSEAARIYVQALRQWTRGFRKVPAFNTILSDFDDNQPPKIRGAILQHKIAAAHERNSDYDLALKNLEIALSELPPRQPRQTAKIAVTKCLTLFRKGQYEDAIRWGHIGLSLSKRTGDRRNLAYAYNMLAPCYLDTGSIGRAIRYRRSALSHYTELGDLSGQADANNNLGVCFQVQGNQEHALYHFKIALALYERIGNFTNTAIVHNNIGEVLLTIGRIDEAISYLQEVVETYEKKGDPVGCCGLALVNLARAHRRKGDFQNAFDYLERGTKLLKKAGVRKILVEGLLEKSELLLATSQIDAALSTCHKALRDAQNLGTRMLEVRGLHLLGRIDIARGLYEQAGINLRQSANLAKHINATYERGVALMSLAEMYTKLVGKKTFFKSYQSALKQATAIFRQTGAQADLTKVLQMQRDLRL